MLSSPNVRGFLNLALPRRPWLIEHWLPGDGFTLLHGGPKAGKSTLAWQLCEALATGTPFLGRWSASRPLRTVYVQADAGAGEWQGFLAPHAQDSQVGIITDLDWGSLASAQASIRDTLTEYAAEFVVFDSLYKLKLPQMDLHKAEGVALVFQFLNQLYRGPYLLVHHARKEDKKQDTADDPVDAAAGHHTLTATASAIWSLNRAGAFNWLGRGVKADSMGLERIKDGDREGLWQPKSKPAVGGPPSTPPADFHERLPLGDLRIEPRPL